MDFRLPLAPDDPRIPRHHGPVPLWMLIALIAAVLGLAIAVAGVVTDPRDTAARHAAVLRSQAL